jgi:acid phosphatase (class A)
MIRRFFHLVTLLAALSQCEAQQFLPKDCSALVDLLPAPPATNSPAGRADLETLLQVQADRTPAQVERAKRVADQTVSSFAQPVLGDWFHIEDFPRTKELFEEFGRECRSIVDDQVKRRWNRTRPFVFSTAVHPVVGRSTGASYPSGHAAAAAVWGTIFAAAFPEKAEGFKAQIHEVMWCRVLGGAHYPSDTAAGELLGEAIANTMLKSPEMQQALATIRKEISAAIEAKRKSAPASEPAVAK